MKFGLAVIVVIVGLFVKEGVEEEERHKLMDNKEHWNSEKHTAFGTHSLLEVSLFISFSDFIYAYKCSREAKGITDK
jgi:hypothetical protein